MYKNSKLGFDIDGPLFPFSTVCYKIINRKYNYDFSEVEFWSRKNRSNRFYGKHREEIEDIVADPRTYMEPPINNVTESVIKTLANKYGNEIFYITARPKHLRPVTEMWLGDMPDTENLLMGFDNKSDIIKELNLDFYTDDRYEIIVDVLDNNPNVDARLFFADYLSYDDVVNSGVPYLLHMKLLLRGTNEW